MNKIFIILPLMISIVLFFGHANAVFGDKGSNFEEIRIITEGDLYVESEFPSKVAFNVIAKDNANNELHVECDKTTNSFFEVGKTTVRCMTIDKFGNEVRDSFVITVGYNIVQIPDWFKQTTELWATKKISNDTYIEILEFLLKEKIITIPTSKAPKDNNNVDLPIWINNNAEKWIKGEISNDEFSISIKWMLDQGIVQNNINK
ncbi:plastocyanin [Nitrosopumilus sp.]|uniref:plastocyanin n=1 Tax=Nitrosopumilus sp. TaxID=2024843 RepID=UPI003B594E76